MHRFNGDKKHLIHFLVPYEERFIKVAVPLVPAWVNTTHLTLMTTLWSVAVIAAGYVAQHDLRWMWAFSAAILLQYITDMLDGAVGRSRDNGLIKWGFYMDHMLDYCFMSSIVIGYSFLLPWSQLYWSLLCLACMGGFMVHAFMDFSITNNFKISCNQFGVSEMRFLLIFFNIGLMIFGKALLVQTLPVVVLASGIGLCCLIFMSQKVYQHIDTLQQARRDEVPFIENPQGGIHGRETAKNI